MRFKSALIAVCLLLLAGIVQVLPARAKDSPVGVWKTYDDKSGEIKSIVRVWEKDGQLMGRIEKIFPGPGEDPDPVCEKCTGKRKNRPVLGMVFLWGFSLRNGQWQDGRVLDPENGKIYRCSLKVMENGKKMKVFGYIKIIFKIGRSQTWTRVLSAEETMPEA